MGEEQLPPEVLVRACAARMSKEMGSQVSEEALEEIHRDAVASLARLVEKAMTEKYPESENAGEGEAERELRNLLPRTGDAFRFGVAKGSTAASPNITQKVKTIICEGWRGGGSPIRLVLQSIAVTRPDLVSRKSGREDEEKMKKIELTNEIRGARAKLARELGGHPPDGVVAARTEARKEERTIELFTNGYYLNGMRVGGFPRDGGTEYQEAWLDQLRREPIEQNWNEMLHVTPAGKEGRRVSYLMDLSDIISIGGKMVIKGERREEAKAEREASRGSVTTVEGDSSTGGSIETARFLVGLDGRTMGDVARLVAGQISHPEAGVEELVNAALAASARGGVGVNLEEEFNPTKPACCRKIVRIMNNIRGHDGGDVPSEFLILAEAGDYDSILRSAGSMIGGRKELRQRYDPSACVEAALDKKQLGGAYPFQGSREEREVWRNNLTPQNLYQRKDGVGVTSFTLPKEIVLAACDKIDEVWGNIDGSSRPVLQALLTTRGIASAQAMSSEERETADGDRNLVRPLRREANSSNDGKQRGDTSPRRARDSDLEKGEGRK